MRLPAPAPAALALIIATSACASDLDVDRPAPVADAGFDQVRFATTDAPLAVELDARASCDPLDLRAPVEAEWRLVDAPAGSSAAITHLRGELTAGFVADLPGTYLISLVVRSGERASEPDNVEVRVASGAGEDVVLPPPDTDACGGPLE